MIEHIFTTSICSSHDKDLQEFTQSVFELMIGDIETLLSNNQVMMELPILPHVIKSICLTLIEKINDFVLNQQEKPLLKDDEEIGEANA